MDLNVERANVAPSLLQHKSKIEKLPDPYHGSIEVLTTSGHGNAVIIAIASGQRVKASRFSLAKSQRRCRSL